MSNVDIEIKLNFLIIFYLIFREKNALLEQKTACLLSEAEAVFVSF